MLRRPVRSVPANTARRCARVWLPSLALLASTAAWAQTDIGPVTVGAGLRTSFVNTNPDGGPTNSQFELNDIRLYVSGTAYKDVKFMFNTDYSSITNSVNVLDAVARIEVSPQFNIWAGRFLPPSDRANLYGPFYRTRVERLYRRHPGRIPLRLSGPRQRRRLLGHLRQKSEGFARRLRRQDRAPGIQKTIGAARVQIDFWDPEDGYYLNGTYYGDKNLLAIGGATQVQDGHTAQHRRFPDGEASCPTTACSPSKASTPITTAWAVITPLTAKSQGAYGLASYLFPKKVGRGSVRDPRQVCQGGIYPRRHTQLQPEDHWSSISTTSSSSSTCA